jgi:lysozyme family protein
MTDFDTAIAFVFKAEGYYSDDKNDPGGKTKYGISQKAYPDLNIQSLTRQDAEDIYRRDYWKAAGCDSMQWPLSLVVFDTAVNLGVKRAQRIEKESFNWSEYLFIRLAVYSKLVKNSPRFGIYLRGWMNRVINLHKEAVKHTHPIAEEYDK